MRLALAFLLCLVALPVSASCICLKCALPQYENFLTTSEHMSPTMEVGECHVARVYLADRDVLAAGDVIAFRHPQTGAAQVSRIIGMPGDTVQMIGGIPNINGVPVGREPAAPLERAVQPYPGTNRLPRCPGAAQIGATCKIERFIETLPNGARHYTLDLKTGGLVDDTAISTVPEGHLFVIGDHRDNSLDSRVAPYRGGIGFVPIANVISIFEELSSP